MSAVCGFCACCTVFGITFLISRRKSIHYNHKMERAMKLTNSLIEAKDAIQQKFEKVISGWNMSYTTLNGRSVSTPKLRCCWEEYSYKLPDLLKEDRNKVDNMKTVDKKIMDVTFNTTEEYIPAYNKKESSVSHMLKIIEETGYSFIPHIHGVKLQDICSASEEYQISFYEVDMKHKWSYSHSEEVTAPPPDTKIAHYDARKDLWERVDSSHSITNEEAYIAGYMDSDTAMQKQFTCESNRSAYITHAQRPTVK